MSIILFEDEYIVLFNTLIYKKGLKTISSSPSWLDDGKIRRIIMPDTVEKIEDSVFGDFEHLRSVRFSKNLKTIGKYAFKNCYRLKNVHLPNGLELIDESAFADCHSLREVRFHKGMRGIDRNAFARCVRLKNVSIEGSFYEILGFGVFEGTPYLQKLREQNPIVIVDGILIDGANCKGDVEVPNNVIEVAAGAFRNNQELTSVSIPETVKLVSNSAFEGCINLRKAVLRFTSGIAENLFRDCLSLGEIIFPKTIEVVYPNAFTNTPWLKKQQQEEKLVVLDQFLVDGKGCKGDVRISNVKEIVDEAFMGNADIISVEVDDGCDKIGSKAFRQCRMLKSVRLPRRMKDMGSFLFSGCDNLEYFRIPEEIETIRYSTFYSCLSLKSIEIPDSLKVIQNYAFNDCFSLCLPELEHVTKESNFFNKDEKNKRQVGCVLTPTLEQWDKNGYTGREDIVEITVPEGVVTIGKEFFSNCYNLKKVILPESLVEIDDRAFYYCSELEYINIPKNLKKIGNEAFHSTGISEIVLPEGLETIPKSCFERCKSLAHVHLPSSLYSIGEDAFYYCKRLVSIELPSHLVTIERCAFSYSGLVSIDVPDGVATIANYVFSDCGQLRRVKLPATLPILPFKLFYNCHSLEEVVLPLKLEEIESNAFAHCATLTHLEVPASLRKVESEAFDGCVLFNRSVFGKNVKVHRDAFGEGFLTRNCEAIQYTMIVFGVAAALFAIVGLFWIFLPLKTALLVVGVIVVVLFVIGFLYLSALGKAFSQG